MQFTFTTLYKPFATALLAMLFIVTGCSDNGKSAGSQAENAPGVDPIGNPDPKVQGYRDTLRMLSGNWLYVDIVNVEDEPAKTVVDGDYMRIDTLSDRFTYELKQEGIKGEGTFYYNAGMLTFNYIPTTDRPDPKPRFYEVKRLTADQLEIFEAETGLRFKFKRGEPVEMQGIERE